MSSSDNKQDQYLEKREMKMGQPTYIFLRAWISLTFPALFTWLMSGLRIVRISVKLFLNYSSPASTTMHLYN